MIDRYAYLLLGLFFLALWIACYRRRKDLRNIMLQASFAGAISGPLSEIWYFRDYWLPPTIVGQGVLSPEDVLFGFSVFGVAAVAYLVLSGRMLVATGSRRTWVMPTYAISFFVGFLLFTDLFGLNSIVAASLTMILWAVGIVIVRRDLLMLSLGSGLLLALFSIVIYVPMLHITAGYLQRYWFLFGQPLGMTVLGGVPLTEIVWYFCLGSATPVVCLWGEGNRSES